MAPYKACLFDMDGTIINTEDLYTVAASKLLARYGKGPLSWDVKIHLQGRPGPEAARLLMDSYDINDISVEQWQAQAFEIQEDLWRQAQWLPGALELLQWLSANNIPIALGTSSNTKAFRKKTGHLSEGFDLFGKHIVCGDDARIPKGKGKPNPDIWYACLDSINQERKQAGLEPIAIEECIVFEDGLPGVISGKNANAHVVWIPHPEARPYLGGDAAEAEVVGTNGTVLDSIKDFDKTLVVDNN
ncbi:hypothetical protein DIURU_000164 [Diutina rugosa]|uniref:Uncharacterized protein n=1 Tax=Diutina rugosa TaxID=5481 RepID=A0A642V4P9_DIURU|nr:uncharacterized protein DIURU_000164 [Diutina rugosa]KAA8908621.1 hypothetical protein DIURU_000164 [Diutina rugosa]